MRRARDVSSKARHYPLKDLRKGVTVNFLIALLSLAIATYFIWGFDYVDRMYDSVVMNLLLAVLPFVAFYQAMQQEDGVPPLNWWQVDPWQAGIAFFLGLFTLLAISNTYDFHELGINIVVIIVSAPWLFIFWILIRSKRILAIGMVPAGILLMMYWVLPGLMGGWELHYTLIPLTAVSALLASWTLLVWVLFKGVEIWPKHPTLGPLMESFGMLFLFSPMMVLAIWVPRAIPGGDDWSVVLAVMVGVVFSSVVSEPLARFLRNYGDLPSPVLRARRSRFAIGSIRLSYSAARLRRRRHW